MNNSDVSTGWGLHPTWDEWTARLWDPAAESYKKLLCSCKWWESDSSGGHYSWDTVTSVSFSEPLLLQHWISIPGKGNIIYLRLPYSKLSSCIMNDSYRKESLGRLVSPHMELRAAVSPPRQAPPVSLSAERLSLRNIYIWWHLAPPTFTACLTPGSLFYVLFIPAVTWMFHWGVEVFRAFSASYKDEWASITSRVCGCVRGLSARCL